MLRLDITTVYGLRRLVLLVLVYIDLLPVYPMYLVYLIYPEANSNSNPHSNFGAQSKPMSKRSGATPNGEDKSSASAASSSSSPKYEDKQARLLNATNPGHFSLIRAYHLADLITLMNGFCGFMSITSSMRYCIDPRAERHLWAALAFMPFGLFFDFFDGKVARWRGKSSLMGQELDSLADLVSLPDCVVSC